MSFKGIIGGTYKLLDNYEIPLIGLGTYALWNQEEVDRAVDAALAAGYRLFDTANFYNNEKELGIAFKVFECLMIDNKKFITKNLALV
ncbi:unnamed protein product [Meloidogyne enterolobii]|uniref:Uncharacterized protein n=1 Tax=Meloidogyne enterolobii TaxID=390850 RepID=A0ACB1AG13_MELEN